MMDGSGLGLPEPMSLLAAHSQDSGCDALDVPESSLPRGKHVNLPKAHRVHKAPLLLPLPSKPLSSVPGDVLVPFSWLFVSPTPSRHPPFQSLLLTECSPFRLKGSPNPASVASRVPQNYSCNPTMAILSPSVLFLWLLDPEEKSWFPTMVTSPYLCPTHCPPVVFLFAALTEKQTQPPTALRCRKLSHPTNKH